MESIPTIMVFCNRAEEEHARNFAINNFGESAFTLCPTDSRPTLLNCPLCEKTGCPSQTGYQNDKACRPWVGPGSPILGLTKRMWKKIQNNLNRPKTLEDVIACHKQIVESGNGDKPFMEFWSVGCFERSLINADEEVILTAAHPLDGSDKTQPAPLDALNDPNNSSLVFLTQVKINDIDMVKVLGYVSNGIYSKLLGVDILMIHPCKDIKRYMCSKIKSTCRPNYVNVKPYFQSTPELKRNVIKRGSVSGNTFGRICTREHLFMLVRTTKHKSHTKYTKIKKEVYRYVDAFAVSYAQTECMADRTFADKGDSGSVIFDASKHPENKGNERNAYGIVWQRLKIYNEIEKKQSEETVCCKINNCIDYLNAL